MATNPTSIDRAYTVKQRMAQMFSDTLYTTAMRKANFYGTKPIQTWDYETIAGPRAARIRFRAGLDGSRLYDVLTRSKGAFTRALFNAIPGWDLPGDPMVNWEGDNLVVEALFPVGLQLQSATLDDIPLRPTNGRYAILGLRQDWEYVEVQYKRNMEAHTLIVGATGSGKSTTTKTIICQLARADNAQFALIDGKGGFDGLEELSTLRGLVGPLAYSQEDALAVMQWATRELDRRDTADKCESPIHIVVDEFQEFTSNAEWAAAASRLGRMGRSKNIHLTFITQRPDKAMWGQAGTSLKAQFVNVILHTLTSYHDVLTVTGSGNPPAHLLSGAGDAYFISPSQGTQRVQVAMLSPRDYQKVTGVEPGNQWAAHPNANTKFSTRQQMAAVYVASLRNADSKRGGRGTLQKLLEQMNEPEKSNSTADELLEIGRLAYTEFEEGLNA